MIPEFILLLSCVHIQPCPFSTILGVLAFYSALCQLVMAAAKDTDIILPSTVSRRKRVRGQWDSLSENKSFPEPYTPPPPTDFLLGLRKIGYISKVIIWQKETGPPFLGWINLDASPEERHMVESVTKSAATSFY